MIFFNFSFHFGKVRGGCFSRMGPNFFMASSGLSFPSQTFSRPAAMRFSTSGQLRHKGRYFTYWTASIKIFLFKGSFWSRKRGEFAIFFKAGWANPLAILLTSASGLVRYLTSFQAIFFSLEWLDIP